MWITETMAEFVADIAVGEVSDRALEAAKVGILDLLGGASAGYGTAAAGAVRDLAVVLVEKGASGIWFSADHRRPIGAAFANSAAASALDLDDGHAGAVGHPGACVIPAALAVAQESGATGVEVLASIVIGYEVAVRIAEARVSATVDSVATGRWGCYGAAAAGGRLKRLSADRIAHALAIAGMQAPSLPPPAPGHVSTSGHLVKEGIPWSTLTGLAALELAERGFTGRTAVLDHPSHFDARRLVHGLGATWAIEHVYFKPYSCCRWLHAALDAFLSLRDEHGLRAFEIEGVSVDTFGMVLTLSNHVAPASLEAAQFSTPFCIAVAAHEGASGLLPLRPELLGRSDLIDLARKVTLRADPDIDKRFPEQRSARVIVEARGTTFERTVTQPLGDPANPMTPSQIRAKFSTLAAEHWSAEDQEKVVAAVESMHRQEGWRSLERLLTADRIGSRS